MKTITGYLHVALGLMLCAVVLIVGFIPVLVLLLLDSIDVRNMKLTLWRLGLRKDKCPYCGDEILKVGYVKDFYQNCRCVKTGCKFNV